MDNLKLKNDYQNGEILKAEDINDITNSINNINTKIQWVDFTQTFLNEEKEEI